MNNKLYCINPNTKEYEELKTIYGIDIEVILDLIRDYKFNKFEKLEEIEKLHSIIKEVREYIEENMKEYGGDIYITCSELLEILDKENT